MVPRAKKHVPGKQLFLCDRPHGRAGAISFGCGVGYSGRVTRLIKADLPASGKRDLGDQAPPRLLQGGAGDAPLRQRGNLGLEIITHEVQLVTTILIGRMKSGLTRRQSEDQPTIRGIDRLESNHVAEEGAIGLGVFAIDDDVAPKIIGPPERSWVSCPLCLPQPERDEQRAPIRTTRQTLSRRRGQ